MIYRTILFTALFLPSLTLANTASIEKIKGEWVCNFTFPFNGDIKLKETWLLDKNKIMQSSGNFIYYLPKENENAHFSFKSSAKWEYYNNTIHIKYDEFDIKPENKFSQKYLNEINDIYLKPSIFGSRLTKFFIKAWGTDNAKMLIGDEYDTWECKKEVRK